MQTNKTSYRAFSILILLSLLLSAVCTPGLASAPAQASGPQDPYEPEPARPLYGVAGVEAQTNMTPEAIEQLKAGQDDAEQPQGPAVSDYPSSVIAYQRYDLEYSNWDIYLSGDGGAGSRILNTQSNEIQPRLDRQSTKLTYLVPTSGHYAIYTLDFANNNRKTRLTFFDADAVYPCWSPDGTKIVFEGYQNGNQGEIYVMNADGSNITRLTYNEGDVNTDYDGMPAWSPDGSRIAFISKRTGGYRVWVMNADGSNPLPLSSQAYSAHPVWSWDSLWIGYDADGNNNGWNELWKMRSNGTEQQNVIEGNVNVEYYAGSFSPVGNTLISTETEWRLIGSTYYLVSARIAKAWRNWIISGDYNMNPDWKTTDRVLPTVWMDPLPAISPAPVPVNYGCNDAEAGIYYCNLMVREGPGGAWQLYDPANAPLLGGHGYTFRVDATDKGGNVNARANEYDAFTTIETEPPSSSLFHLEPYTMNNSVLLQWHGSDAGGSGVARYHLQYTEWNSGEWMDYASFNASTHETVFTGTGGMNYNFRIAAVDRAGNSEPWDEINVVSTTLISRQVSGSVRDAFGAPIGGAAMTYAVDPFESYHPDNGSYRDWFGQSAEGLDLTISASHPDFVGWSSKDMGPVQDVRFDVYLRPTSINIGSGDFDEPWPLTGWVTAGDGLLPYSVLRHSHSGNGSVFLGHPLTFSEYPFGPADDNTCSVISKGQYQGGNLHALTRCGAYNQFVIYHQIYQNGAWTTPNLVFSPGKFALVDAFYGANGDILMYYGSSGSFYRQYIHGQGWQAPQNADGYFDQYYYAYDLQGGVHQLFKDFIDGEFIFYYSKMSRDGVWSAPEEIASSDNRFPDVYLYTDEYNHPVIIWDGTIIGQTPDGQWRTPVALDLTDIKGVQDHDNRLHILGKTSGTNQLYYAMWNGQSGRLLKQSLVAWDAYDSYSLKIDQHNNVHILGTKKNTYEEYWLYYAFKPENGVVQKTIILYKGIPFSTQFVIDSEDALLIYVRDGQGNERILKLSRHWGAYEVELAPSDLGYYKTMYMDGQDHIHFIDYTKEYLQDAINPMDPINAPTASQYATLSKTATVPAAEESPVLSFMYEPTRTSGPGSPFSVQVIDGSQTTTVFTPQEYRSGWQHAAVDMSPWGGRQVTIQFKVQENAGAERTGIYLDEVSLGPVYPDVYLPGSSRDVQPGDEVTFSVAYGNQGGAPANGTQLELTLPAGLSYVSASIEPVETSPTLKWNLGDLARGTSGTFSLTLAVATDVPLGVELSAPLSISTARELQTWNNAGSLLVFTGHRVYMPVLRK